MEYLYDKLLKYSQSDYYAFHMPGHKRNQNLMDCKLPYELDITEIDGFDDLHHAREILKEAQKRAALLYHAEETHYLINGSTSGILSAILGSTSKGDKILVARNCHKSVYHAIYLNELNPVYIYPEYDETGELNGEIQVKDIERILQENQDIKGMVLTSPTYDGVVSDIRGIAEILHKRDIPLIVDEAHGAHFGLHSYFPENSNVKGADVVIHSLHKTLPSLTQTALLHMNGNLIDRRRICRYLHILQTSSPSYVLMAGMDECVRMFLERGAKCLDKYVNLLKNTRNRLKQFSYLRLIETRLYDPSKLVISVKGTGLNGRQLYDILLKRYHLQMEMAAGSYVLAMTSAGDTKEGMERLIHALLEIDHELANTQKPQYSSFRFSLPRLKQKYRSAEVERLILEGTQCSVKSVDWKDSIQEISAEYAYVYPPGIPLLVPGEIISKEAAKLLCKYEDMGFSIEGLQEEGKIEVLVNG